MLDIASVINYKLFISHVQCPPCNESRQLGKQKKSVQIVKYIRTYDRISFHSDAE